MDRKTGGRNDQQKLDTALRKQTYTMLLAGFVVLVITILIVYLPERAARETAGPQASTTAVQGSASPQPAAIKDPTLEIAAWFQGPKAWKKRLDWSGEWGREYYDGRSFGGFGCGLCCMANIYCSKTPWQCSPLDMYKYAKQKTEYEGGGAIDWGYMKETLKFCGFTSDVWRKPKQYREFQRQVRESMAVIAVVSSNDSTCYWKDTSGHYVTILLYDSNTDRIFLGDSGDPSHNRQWVSLKKIYRSLKKANRWQYLTVTAYDEKKDTWKNTAISGNCIVPDYWNSRAVKGKR